MIDEALVRFTAHQLPREDLHALMARSDGPALRRTAWHLGVLAITGALLWRLRVTAWALPLLVAHGYVLAFVFCAFHEAAHRTAFRTRWLNTVVGTLAGLLIFWPYRNYRVYHWEHHRFTQDEARGMMSSFQNVTIRQVFSPGDLLLNQPSARFRSPIFGLFPLSSPNRGKQA